MPLDGLPVSDHGPMMRYRFDRHTRRNYFTLLQGNKLREALASFGAHAGGVATYAAFSTADFQAPHVRQPKTWLYVRGSEIPGFEAGSGYKLQDLSGWIRRHIRKCFWLRWKTPKGRINALRRLGVRDRALGIAYTGLGAWAVARSQALHHALKTSTLNRYGFVVPWDFAGARM